MKVYLITEKEMVELREKLRIDWLEHCDRFGLRPALVNDPNHHDYDLFAKFNFTYCRWMSEVGGDRYAPDLRPSPAIEKGPGR